MQNGAGSSRESLMLRVHFHPLSTFARRVRVEDLVETQLGDREFPIGDSFMLAAA